VIDSRDYVRPCDAPTASNSNDNHSNDMHERRVVTRKLQQAMLPGPELVRVQVLGSESACGAASFVEVER
jgi:hypothetical protein